MKPWVAERMKVFLPKLAPLTLFDAEQIAALCAAEIEAWKDRPGLKSILSLKEPLKDARNAIKQLPLTAENSYVNRHGETEHIALKYLTFSEETWREMKRPSEQKFHARLTHQSMIYQPDEIVIRIERLLQSNYWEEVAAGLCVGTGRRISEVLKHGMVREGSLYSVWFSGQRKSERLGSYEIPTLVASAVVVSAWGRLRTLRDFSGVEDSRLSSSHGPTVKAVIGRVFADLVEVPEGRAELYTHMVRAVYPRLAMFFFLPARVNETAYAAAVLGHSTTSQNGESEPDYGSSLYYMSYKICNTDGVVDSRQGIKLAEPGVEMLEQFKQEERIKTMAEMAETQVSGARTKIGVNRATKAAFDDEQETMGCATADEAVAVLVRDHRVYRQVCDLLDSTSLDDLLAILVEVREIALEGETPLDCLRAAVADKKRFRSTYEKRTALNAERDYGSMSLSELRNIRTIEASRERWRRAVDQIMEYNDAAAIPELRWYINAAAVKALVGGRGAEIGRYLKAEWQAELDEHHAKYGLRPGHNHARTNIRERVLGDAAALVEDEEE